jgi:hypothetical protein
VPPSVQFATPAVSLATDDDEDQLLFVVVNEGQPSHAQSVTSVAGGKKKPLAKKSQRKSATGNVAQQQSIWSWKMSTEMGALDRLASKYPIATDRSSSPIVSLYALSSSRLVCVHSDGRLTLLNDRTDLVASTSAEG